LATDFSDQTSLTWTTEDLHAVTAAEASASFGGRLPPDLPSQALTSDAKTRPRRKYAKLCYAGRRASVVRQTTEDLPR
jgi:hypothetical protein